MEALEGVTDNPADGAIHCTITAALELLSQLPPVVLVAVKEPPTYTSVAERPESVQVLPVTDAVPNNPPSMYILTVPAPVTAPEREVAPSVTGPVTVKPELLVWVPITTAAEEALTSLPVAVAVAVTDAPNGIVKLLSVHPPDELDVVVPTEMLFENT